MLCNPITRSERPLVGILTSVLLAVLVALVAAFMLLGVGIVGGADAAPEQKLLVSVNESTVTESIETDDPEDGDEPEPDVEEDSESNGSIHDDTVTNRGNATEANTTNETTETSNDTEVVDNDTESLDDAVNATGEDVEDAVDAIDNDTESLDDAVNTTVEDLDGTANVGDGEVSTLDDIADASTDSSGATTSLVGEPQPVQESLETLEGSVDETAVTIDESLDAAEGTIDGDLQVGSDEYADDSLATLVQGTLDDGADWTGLVVGGEHGDTEWQIEEATDEPGATQEQDRSTTNASTAGSDHATFVHANDVLPTDPVDAIVVGILAIIATAGAMRVSAAAPAFITSAVHQPVRLQARTAASAFRAWLDRLPRFIPIPGYSRYDASDPLENEHRASLHAQIASNPGITMTELIEDTEIARSTARYHLRILEHEGLVVPAKLWGHRRFYLEPPDEGGLHAALEDDCRRAVIETIARHEPTSGAFLSDEIGRDPSTIAHHLDRLAEAGIVVRERNGRTVLNRLGDGTRRELGINRMGPANQDLLEASD